LLLLMLLLLMLLLLLLLAAVLRHSGMLLKPACKLHGVARTEAVPADRHPAAAEPGVCLS
jgi:hypothetical protein